ncbi:MAG: hypothetical protein HQK79_03885 [Desulfobacterales bacterium]|nr:hypothetical protein [Desulfobacterales bacterium]
MIQHLLNRTGKIKSNNQLIFVFIFGLLELVNFGFWYFPNRTIPMDNPYLDDGLIKSFSFAPFRRGQDPSINIHPTHEQIDSDLNVLKGIVSEVRTYGARGGLEIVPALASKYGMTVIHSAWIKGANNEAEILSLIDQANRYPDTIKRVIVGNEVLLRKDLKVQELADIIRRVRTSVKQPVSYADVWNIWLKYPELAKEVDYITIHILPYWDDNPIDVNKAMDHIKVIYSKIHETFPDKPILIGEVGWPTAGRSRERAVPSLVNAAQFHNSFLNIAKHSNWDYNVIEAFDQIWKIKHEGTVGGHWGLMDSNRKPKFKFGKPVSENPYWLTGFIASSLLSIISFIWGEHKNRLTKIVEHAVFAVLCQMLAVMIIVSLFHSLKFDFFSNIEFIEELLKWSLQLALSFFVITEAKNKFNQTVSINKHRDINTIIIDFVVLLFIFLAIYKTAMLIFDGRYRNFPTNDFLVPAFGVLFGRWMIDLIVTKQKFMLKEATYFRILAEIGLILMLISGTICIIYLEKLTNLEAVIWGGTLLTLSLPRIATAYDLIRRLNFNTRLLV